MTRQTQPITGGSKGVVDPWGRVAEAGLLGSQVGHAGPQLIEGEEVSLVRGYETRDSFGHVGELELQAGAGE